MAVKYIWCGIACCDYFLDEWRTMTFTCPECGWRGNHEDMSGPDHWGGMFDFECPQCERTMLVLRFPTYKELCKEALRGNEKARGALRLAKSVREFVATHRRQKG